jgi:hypothetical protein
MMVPSDAAGGSHAGSVFGDDASELGEDNAAWVLQLSFGRLQWTQCRVRLRGARLYILATSSERQLAPVGPRRYHSPRHPTHFKPSWRAVNCIPSRDDQYQPCLLPATSSARIVNPRCIIYIVSYDVTMNVSLACCLPRHRHAL